MSITTRASREARDATVRAVIAADLAERRQWEAWHAMTRIRPTAANARACGCAIDVVAFGHRDCHGGMHGCPCRECGCWCHRRAS